jgi:hypothetical protein
MPTLTLLTTTGQIHRVGGLNWGLNILNHTRPFDAYIPIHIAAIRKNPGFFFPKLPGPNRATFEWDDGTVMTGLFEGTQTDLRTNTVYPKQISSTPSKDTLGIYLRARLGVRGNRAITLNDLARYGRSDVTITHLRGNRYRLDFS